MRRKTTLQDNPFHVLGVTTRDDRRRVVEQAEERSLHVDHDICKKARSDLTNPRSRLAAEMSWMPAVAPSAVERLVRALLDDPVVARSEEGLPALARANLMAAALEVVSEDEPASSIAEFVRDFASVVEEIAPEEVRRDVNEDRAISGFPEVRGIDAVEEELTERRKSYRGILRNLLDSMDPDKLVEAMTDIVDGATSGGEELGPSLIHELADSYELEAQGFLQREYENVIALVGKARRAAPRGEAAVAQIVDQLGRVARNWDRVAQPIQLSARSRGIVHKPSRDVAYQLRGLGVDLNNEHGMLDVAHRIVELLRELFAELPEVAERLGEDAQKIAGLRRQEAVREKNRENRERDVAQRRRGRSLWPWAIAVFILVHLLKAALQ